MIALYAAVPSKTLADLSEKKEIKEGVAISALRSILFLLFLFCYRRFGSVKVKLVLKFSMELNSVYTIQNLKYLFSISMVKSLQRNEKKSVKPADLILKYAFRH